MSGYGSELPAGLGHAHPAADRLFSLEIGRRIRSQLDQMRAGSFLRPFLAISAAFCVLWQASLYLDLLLDQRRQQVETSEATRLTRNLLAKTMETFAADLRIVASGRNLRRLALGEETAREAVGEDFRITVAEKPAIAQLRFLDHRGNEVVRVDRRGEKIILVDREELQNKAERYYFRQTIGLPAGGLYVSPIDLNIEHGAVELPWKPVMRLAIPLRPGEGSSGGVVVINLDATGFIDDASEALRPGSEPLQLLNQNGYWLAGVPDDRLWGFMFGRDTTLAKADPEVWRRLTEVSAGEFDLHGSRYSFQTLRPVATVAFRGEADAIRAGDTTWIIVGSVPAVSIGDLWQIDRLPVGVCGLLVIAIVSLGLSRAGIARRRAEANSKRTEAELVRVERLASLGSLVAGIAHELNTPIGNAVTVASTLSQQAAEFGAAVESGQVKRSTLADFLRDLRDGTAIMQRGLDRASELIRHFKQVAVDQASEQRRRFRVSDLLRDVAGSLEPQLKRGAVVLETDIRTQCALDSYPGALGQVLINLVANAQLHGFDEGATGRIVVTAADLPSQQVEIVVRDDGKGMAPEVLERIFEPFFTTRLGAGGSGLGLSIVFNIVTNVLGGKIRAESRPASGTTIILHLPHSAPTEDGGQARSSYHVE